jgi:hypothetical protein
MIDYSIADNKMKNFAVVGYVQVAPYRLCRSQKKGGVREDRRPA